MMKHIISAAITLTCVSAMSAQTVNHLVIEEKNGTVTSIPTTEIEGVLFEEERDYTQVPVLLNAVYTPGETLGTYTLELGNAQPDQNGDPANIDDVQIAISLCGPASADGQNAQLPEGYYRIGTPGSPFSINAQATAAWVRVEEGSNGIANAFFIFGSADVRREGNIYDIRIELEPLSMEGSMNLQFKGELPFRAAPSEFEGFTEDVNVTFTGAQGRFYGNWFYPFADDCVMQFFSGEFDDTGRQVEGYWLNVDANMPLTPDPMDPNQHFADGVYKLESREVVYDYTYMPFTYNPGKEVDMWGETYYSGTYIMKIDKSGRRYIALINGGTVTISNGGTKATFDFTTIDGKKVTGTFLGNPFVANFCDNDVKQPKGPFSRLTADHVLDFTPSTVGLAYRELESYVPGLETYRMWITDIDQDKGDYLQFTFLSNGSALQNGTYTIGDVLQANYSFKGRPEYGGQPLFSWYADFNTLDAEGAVSVLAPLVEGTFTVSDGTMEPVESLVSKKITFNFVDDKGNIIDGSWDGYLMVEDNPTPEAAAKIPARKARTDIRPRKAPAMKLAPSTPQLLK